MSFHLKERTKSDKGKALVSLNQTCLSFFVWLLDRLLVSSWQGSLTSEFKRIFCVCKAEARVRPISLTVDLFGSSSDEVRYP
jgi:hypothetical protein